jgi:hypothetical protein
MGLFKGRVAPSGKARTAAGVRSRPMLESLERRALLSTTLFAADVVPALTSNPDNSPVEVGVRFNSDVNGFVSGVRFYKGADNTGTHVGTVWSAGGAVLGRATFTTESADGWQQVNFDAPVQINAHTDYVASYLAPNGHYASDNGFFAAQGVDSAPLHAPQDGVGGGNGLYASPVRGATFPTLTATANNYWVDVVFDTTFTPKVLSASSFDSDANGVFDANVIATFNGPMNAASITSSTVQLLNSSNAVIPATVSYDAATKSAVINPTANLALGATYKVLVKGGASGVHSFDGGSLGGDFNSSFTATETSTYGLWDDSALPSTPSYVPDAQSVEVGTRFRSDVDGSVTGIRFYKGAGNTGTHVGSLWTAGGTLLSSVTFTGESAEGWQQATFATPVNITANTNYVVSYLAPNGNYAVDATFFAGNGIDRGALHAPPDGGPGAGNGLFVYSNGGLFPGSTYNSNNYWVSPVFNQPPSNTAPVAQATAATVAEDGITGITLGASDSQTPTAQLKFKVLSLPTRGLLKFGSAAVTLGQVFTGSPAGLTYEPGAEFDGAGTDAITFNVTDLQGLTSDAATVPITITKAVADGAVVLGADHVLRIGGTSGNDVIAVLPSCTNPGKLRVTFGLTIVADNIPATGVSEIRIWGRGGSDAAGLLGLTTKAMINGGDGNDALVGGDGDDLIIGGLGDDLLTGFGGNDLIVGGDGRDALLGMNGHDVLIAGQVTSTYTASVLRAMSAEWAASKSTTTDEAVEVDRAVTDDDADVLSGGAGCDWFIINLGDKTLDFSKTSGNTDVITYV